METKIEDKNQLKAVERPGNITFFIILPPQPSSNPLIGNSAIAPLN